MNEEISLNVSENQNVSFTTNDIPNVSLNITEQINQGGSTNYNMLSNKPQINSVELEGNKSFDDLGMSPITNMDLLSLLR